jgi:arabinoxylan arabinofuranohydrolase
MQKLRKNHLLLTLLITHCSLLIFLGCPPDSESPPALPPPVVYFTVTFVVDSGYPGSPVVPSISVAEGTAANGKWPIDPIWLGKEFDGWFDEEGVSFTSASVISGDVEVTASWTDEGASKLENQPVSTVLADLFGTANGFPATLSNSWKIWGHHNALITQGFGADPTAMPYKDRLYIISSNDSLLYTGTTVNEEGGYNDGIQGLRVLSSADMVNWTDHGLINVGNKPTWTNPLYPMPDPVTPFESKSWAPSAVWKKIDGKDKFFIYFGDSGNGIGVISADSPTGPWTSPLDKLLIDRNTPNCDTVANLFDPGVLADDDGWGYMYFGGGGNSLDSGDGRRVKLNKDMISLASTPQTFTAPCLFEDNEFTKINGLYFYSYVTNGAGNSYGLQGTQIACMYSYEPMASLKSFSKPKGIMNSPNAQLITPNENNHHCIFTFKGSQYITYHASTVSQALGITGKKYRSTHIVKITVNDDGTISPITMTRKGVDQLGTFNPYVQNEAETIGIQGGVFTRPDSGASNGMVVTSIDSGDWIALYGVDFGSTGASKITVRVRTPETPADYVGAIELRLDPNGAGVTTESALSSTNTARIEGGTVIGRVQIKAKAGEAGKYTSVTVDLDNTVTGVHDLVFVFYSSLGPNPITKTNLLASHHKKGFEFDQWKFEP